MRNWKTVAHLAWCGVVCAGLSAAAQTTNSSVSSTDLPDSPGATLAKSQPLQIASAQTSGQTAAPTQSQAAPVPSPQTAPPASQPPVSQPPAATKSQPSHAKPVGTAAAESAETSGIAASEPAGAAIAPAKQRRVRTIVLRVGAIVGAGVALGSVVALTAGTPSRPPGAH